MKLTLIRALTVAGLLAMSARPCYAFPDIGSGMFRIVMCRFGIVSPSINRSGLCEPQLLEAILHLPRCNMSLRALYATFSLLGLIAEISLLVVLIVRRQYKILPCFYRLHCL